MTDHNTALSHTTNITARPLWLSSAGACGQHGVYLGPSCPKCVTQVKR